MKRLEQFSFNFEKFKKELKNYKKLLDSKSELSEKNDILPFFKKNKQLASQFSDLSMYYQAITEEIAFEYDIFGDFKCDLVVGSPQTKTYIFIEFEDAKKNSIFSQRKTKYKPEFSSRFEKGYSQIIDWFYKLQGMQNTDDFTERFGTEKISYGGILVIGRDEFMSDSEKKRLSWRAKRVLVDSKRVIVLTYDKLYQVLNAKLNSLSQIIN